MAGPGLRPVAALGSGGQVAERVDEHRADVVGTVEDLGVGEAQRAQARPRVGLIATRSTACSAAVR